MSTLWGLLIAIAIVGFFTSIAIWVAGKLRLGLEVNRFSSAVIAAFVVAIIAGIITWMLSMSGIQDDGGLISGIVHLLISAIVLMISSRYLPGIKVTGFAGALVASLSIGAVYWLGGLLLGLLVS